MRKILSAILICGLLAWPESVNQPNQIGLTTDVYGSATISFPRNVWFTTTTAA